MWRAPPKPIPPGPNQESVWDYPRPAVLQESGKSVRVEVGGVTLVDAPAHAGGVWRAIETSHPPTYYIALDHVATAHLSPSPRRSLCEWKGQARYFDVQIGDRSWEASVWRYPEPTPAFAAIANAVAVYPAVMDAIWLDGVAVSPQPGGFYGGWVTPDVVGPFKGGPGSAGW